MRARFSKEVVERLLTKAGWHRDTESALSLRVERGRPPTYLFEYTAPDGRRRRMTLGSVAALTLDDARKAATVRAGTLAIKGEAGDPLEHKARLRRAAGERLEQAVADLVRQKRRAGQRWVDEFWRAFEADIRPTLGHWPMPNVTRREVARLLTSIAESGRLRTANVCHAILRRTFRWAVATGRLEINPISDMPAPAPHRSRDRVLNDAEIAVVWRACDALGWPFRDAIRLLILTAARRAEIGEAMWSEFDLDGATWTLPAGRAKNKLEHRAPLVPQTTAILRDLPRLDGSAFLFPGKYRVVDGRDRPVSGWSVAKARLDFEITRFRKEAGLPPMAPWVFHDFRRAFASWAIDAGISPVVIDRVLAHKAGAAMSPIARIYARGEMMPQRRTALEAWGAHVTALTGDTVAVANVVALRA